MFIQFSDIFPISMAIFCRCSTHGSTPPKGGPGGSGRRGRWSPSHREATLTAPASGPGAVGLDDWMGC